MDNIDVYNIEFIDLSDVEEKERNWIINSLHTWDPKVKVPWRKSECFQPPVKQTVSSVSFQHVPNNLGTASTMPPNVLLTANTNKNQIVYNHQQIYPMYHHVSAGYPQNAHLDTSVPYQKQSTYLSIPCIGAPDSSASGSTNYSHQVLQTSSLVLNNNDINYTYMNDNSNAYTNTKDAANGIEQNGTSNGQFISNSKYIEIANAVVKNASHVLPKVNHESQGQNINSLKENVPKSAGKSWASLFSTTNSAGIERKDISEEIIGKPLGIVPSFVKNTSNAIANNEPDNNEKNDSYYNDPVFFILGEFLCEYNIDHRTISLQPRGLINRSNYCYINSILQALLACPPVYNLLNILSEKITTTEMKKLIPVIDHMTTFVKEFQYLPAGQRVSRRVDKSQKQDPNLIINCDTPFEPNYIYKMLNGMRSDTFVIEGRQEDAEEFLGCLLNGLNDEMLELMKLVDKKISKPKVDDINTENDLDREWQVMGPKNKGCVTRRTEVIQTPISDIFNGHLRSRLLRTGDKSTDNIQPFFTLQLNIEKVSTVREALEALACKNQLEGVTSSRTNEEVEAWQQVTIEELPYVLILHLKCFDFKLDGCTKIIKALEFPIDLKIDSKLLSSKTNYSPKEKQYKLFAVVYHDGKEATKGHYLTDAYHVGYARWIRYDDASIKAVPEEQVLKPHGTRVPYLLFYRRSDSIRSK